MSDGQVLNILLFIGAGILIIGGVYTIVILIKTGIRNYLEKRKEKRKAGDYFRKLISEQD